MTIPENCKLIAVHDGAGDSATWSLEVQNDKGETVAMLEWPKQWGKWVSDEFLKDSGFECVTA